MLEVRGLHKRYGDLVAVHEVSFTAREGEMVGLLGPNGAGKTTTVSMIAGLLAPDRGEVRVEGAVVRGETDPVKRRMGFVPQDLALHDELSANENLALFGALYGMTGRRAARGDGRRARARRTDRSGQGSRRNVQRRHEAATEPGRGAAARSEDPAARRAYSRSRPAEPERHLLQPGRLSSGRARRWFIRRTTWKRRSACATASLSSITGR